jgi:hypothetical protein
MGKGTVKFVATSGIHKEWLDKKFIEVDINTNTAGALVFETKGEDVFFLNPNFEIRFSPKGIELEGYFLIGNCLGNAAVLISEYESNETSSII